MSILILQKSRNIEKRQLWVRPTEWLIFFQEKIEKRQLEIEKRQRSCGELIYFVSPNESKIFSPNPKNKYQVKTYNY